MKFMATTLVLALALFIVGIGFDAIEASNHKKQQSHQ